MSLDILPEFLEELDKTLGNESLGEKGDADSPLQEDRHGLVCDLKDVWMRLETVGGGIKKYYARDPSPSLAIQFPSE